MTAPQYFAKADFQSLFDVLGVRGYEVVGPSIDQGAIVYAVLTSAGDLPHGWTDVQEAGRYRLVRRDDDAWFGYAVGPHSWKGYLFPPVATVATAHREEGQWVFGVNDETPPLRAFLGVRACELAAIEAQDRIFTQEAYKDTLYVRRRERTCLIAVQCAQAAATCFCTSMNTGPECTHGFDLALTELDEGFVVDIGTTLGEELVGELPTRDASVQEIEAARGAPQRAAAQITRRLDTDGIRDLLMSNLTHPRWREVADRCLSCANCTMVCPTCFCNSVTEVTDLVGDDVERRRQWDSCFNIDFSYMNGGVVRNSIRSRYRQWLTHKLATWYDQFGSSGCVGCGRCITWCPVAIDLTEEVAAIRESSA